MPASVLVGLITDDPPRNQVTARPPDGPIGRWVGDYLRDPSATLLAIVHHLREWAISYGPATIAVLIAGVGALVGTQWWWARRCHAQFLHHARLITVLAPPAVDPAGGHALWSNLVGLLRPAWRRWLAGQPHLGFEYGFSDAGITLRLWVPGVIPPGLVERAIEAAWPGAHTHTTTASPPIPHPQVDQRRLVVGGELRLARPEALPIRTDFDADPLRAVLGAPVGLGRGQYACVQILARPATGRRLAQARYAAQRLHTGGSTHLIGRLLDLITPGMTTRRPTANSGRANGDPQRSLEYSAHNRAIITKQRGSQYETVIRYAVTTLLPTGSGDQKLHVARQLARGRAHALAAAFACYTEHNHYTRHRIRRPATVLTGRQFRHGDLLSVPELAAVAHLPTDTAIPGLQRAGAKAITPPPGIASPSPHAKPIGITDTGHPRPVALRVPDARHHLHVLGATGSGYPDTMYLTELVVHDTVNTMPEKTLLAFADHGELHPNSRGDAVTGTAKQAQEVFDAAAAAGVDVTDVFLTLENEGVDKFEKSWAELLDSLQGQLNGAGS